MRLWEVMWLATDMNGASSRAGMWISHLFASKASTLTFDICYLPSVLSNDFPVTPEEFPILHLEWLHPSLSHPLGNHILLIFFCHDSVGDSEWGTWYPSFWVRFSVYLQVGGYRDISVRTGGEKCWWFIRSRVVSW